MRDPLKDKRNKIDAIDNLLAGLLAERLSVAASMTGLKKKVRDSARETSVLRHAAGLVKNRELRPAVLAVYRELIKQGRRLQQAAKRPGGLKPSA